MPATPGYEVPAHSAPAVTTRMAPVPYPTVQRHGAPLGPYLRTLVPLRRPTYSVRYVRTPTYGVTPYGHTVAIWVKLPSPNEMDIEPQPHRSQSKAMTTPSQPSKVKPLFRATCVHLPRVPHHYRHLQGGWECGYSHWWCLVQPPRPPDNLQYANLRGYSSLQGMAR